MDIAAQLATLTTAVDKLQRQTASRARDAEDTKIQQELRMQALEQRQATLEASLAQLDFHLHEATSQHASKAEELQQTMREMMSQVVSRVADQFDAVQVSVDEAVEGQKMASASHQEAIQEVRRTTVTAVFELQEDVGNRLRIHEGSIAQCKEGVDVVRNAQLVAEGRESEAAEAMLRAIMAFQESIEARFKEFSAAFEEYKQYVGRLRKEVHHLQAESTETHAALVEALGRELEGVGGGVALLQRDVAGLLGKPNRKDSSPI